MKLFFAACLVSAQTPTRQMSLQCRLSRGIDEPTCRLDNREFDCSDKYSSKECKEIKKLLKGDQDKALLKDQICEKHWRKIVEGSSFWKKTWWPLRCNDIPSSTDYYRGEVDEDTKQFLFDVDDIASYEGLPKHLKRKMDGLLRMQACAAMNLKSCTINSLGPKLRNKLSQNWDDLEKLLGKKSTLNAIRKRFRSKVCAIPTEHRLAAKRIVEMTWADAARAGPQVNDENVSKYPGQATASWLLQDQNPCRDETKGLPNDEMVLLSDIDDTWHYSKQPTEVKKQVAGALAGNDYRTNALHPIEQDPYYLNKELWMDEFVPKFFKTIAGEKGWTTASSAKPYPLMKYKWSQGFRKVATTLWTWKTQAGYTGRQFLKEGPQHVAIGQQPGKGGKRNMVGAFLSVVTNVLKQSQHTKIEQFEEQLKQMKDVAQNKADHFERFIESFPELAGQVAFIGDDGQGDFASMRTMLKHKTKGKFSLRFAALKMTHLMTKEEYDDCKESAMWCPSHSLTIDGEHYRTSKQVKIAIKRRHKNLIKAGRLFLFTSYQGLAKQLKKHKNTKIFGKKFDPKIISKPLLP